MTDDSPIIYNPEDVLKKEARGLGNADLGEVQEVNPEYIVTQKGTLVVDKFYIPKSVVERFDDNTVWFKITEEDTNKYKKHTTKPLG
jgi:hypothetical protein